MKNLQVFISFCEGDRQLKEELKGFLGGLIDEYKMQDVHLEIVEMDTHCAGDWDSWMISAVKNSDVVVSLLTENVCYPKSGTQKRVKEELQTARSNDKGIVPIVFCTLPDEYQAHVGCVSQAWWVQGRNLEDVFSEATRKIKILLDGVIKGTPIKQYQSSKIIGGKFRAKQNFVGRRDELQWLKKALDEENIVILKGEGGIGKTTLAKKFFEENRRFYDDAYIIDASKGIKRAIIDCPFDGVDNVMDEEKRYNENVKRLHTLSSKTIIIMDNYDERGEDDEEALMQVNGADCRFVITSRIGLENFSTLNVGRMSDEELIVLVKTHCPNVAKKNQLSESECDELLKDFFKNVDGLTIAVELASAIMKNGDVNLREINEAILKCNETVVVGRENKRAKSFEHLSMLYGYANLNEKEKIILDAVCHVAPWVGVLRRHLRELLELENNEEINDLISKTFLRMDEGNKVSMHPLLSDVYYRDEKVYEFNNEEILRYILDNPIEQDKDNDYSTAKRKNIARYAYVLEKRKPSFGRGESNLYLEYEFEKKISMEYRDLGELNEALYYGEKALALREIIPEDDTEGQFILADIYNNMGNLYSSLGDFGNALAYSEKALSICERIYADNPDHPYIARSYNNLGVTYGDLGDNEKALEYYKKALAIRERIYEDNPDHPDIASSYNNLGVTYGDLGDNEKALEYKKKALAIIERIYADNPDHPDIAMSYNNLGNTYGDLGDNEKALEYYKKALVIRERIYADNLNHPSIAMSYNNLGVTYCDLGEKEKALEYYKKALAIYESIYVDNPDHPYIARSYNNLGNTYSDLGDNEKALEYYEKALAIRERIYADNPDHPYIARSYNNLGNTYGALGDNEKALECHKKAFVIRERIYADNLNHPSIAMSYYNLGVAYGDLGENEKALECYKKVVEIYEALNETGEYDEVLKEARKIVEEITSKSKEKKSLFSIIKSWFTKKK